MIKFANFEFIFAIRGPKLAWRHEEIQNFKQHKIGVHFYIYPLMEQYMGQSSLAPS